MITLSNGHEFEYMVASGALAYDGKGWPWERPLVAVGLIKPQLFTVVTKTLTRLPRKGNLRWWKPWECVRSMEGGSVVNKVGLTNPGIDWWCNTIGPTVDSNKIPLAVSIDGNQHELVEMADMLNAFDLVALEINASCPNTGHPMNDIRTVVDNVKAVKAVSRFPIIIKVSVAQDYCEIVEQLEDVAEAVALNSVPYEIAYRASGTKSPLSSLEKKVGGGAGGVSGKAAQKHNWAAVVDLALGTHAMPVIAPSIMNYDDIEAVRSLGARAFSFGAIHLPSYPVLRKPWTIFTNPCKPTRFVERREQVCLATL